MGMVIHRIVPSASVVCADLNEESVLLNIETGIYFGLDSVGARIWKLIEDGTDDEEIVHRLLGEYEASESELRTDTRAFVAQLAKHGLIEGFRGLSA